MKQKIKKSKLQKAGPEDVGAAMMAWYREANAEYPGGLVSQAQAATMLNVSRMALSRLVSRGYLRAVYFPHPPTVHGFNVHKDDPMWFKILGWLDVNVGDGEPSKLPKACYVSFEDVLALWRDGVAQEKCKIDPKQMLFMKDDEFKEYMAEEKQKAEEYRSERENRSQRN